MAIRHVEPYTDEWLHQPVCYVRQVVELLGAEVADWWEGPCDPRAATVRLAGRERAGVGRGERTGGRAASSPATRRAHRGLAGVPLSRRRAAAPAGAGARGAAPTPARASAPARAWRPCYRSHRNCRDGFDVALDFYAAYIDA